MISLTMMLISVALFLLRVPVSIGLGIATLIGIWMIGVPPAIIPSRMIDGVDSFALLSVPFFILAGNLMNAGGLSERIFAFARALVGWASGGLAQVNVLGSVIFAGMSGSALADLASLGAIEVRSMKSNGYPAPFSAAVTLASCLVGPLIPPSIILVIYGLATNTSIGQLFLGGLVAGLVVAACLMLYIYLYMKIARPDWGRPEPFRAREVLRTGVDGLPALLAPAVILGALILGVATPSELGAIAVVYAIIAGVYYRQFSWPKIKFALVETISMTAVIMYLFAIASALNFIVTRERIAHQAAELMATITTDPVVGIILINIFLVAAGAFLEGPVAILILAPILLEVVQGYGMGSVQFGVMISFNLLIGMITPPVGIGLFVAARVANISSEAVLRASWPFFIPLLAGLAIISYVPWVTEWLPGLVFGR
ncbi:MAG TPA: TRAP transporter large permease [Devosiaceae bacterium]|jgi:tripartite ATP-independent transporter DctM subunit|nr:TRAP transporter large permease [Devosiaceae bacterium]